MPDDIVKELSSGYILHDHKDIGGGGDDLVELNDMGMAKEFQVLNLSSDFPHNVQTLNLLTIQDFDSNLVTRHLVKPN